MFEGDVDTTLGNKIDILVPVKARNRTFKAKSKGLGEFAYYAIRRCFPQWIVSQQ